MRKFFIVLVWGMGLGLAALFTKDIVRGVRNVNFLHFTGNNGKYVRNFSGVKEKNICLLSRRCT